MQRKITNDPETKKIFASPYFLILPGSMTTLKEAATTTKFADVSKNIFQIERRPFQIDHHKGIIVRKSKRENELAASIFRDYIAKSAIANGWGAALDPTQLHVMSAQDVTNHTRTRDANVVLQAGGTAEQRVEREAKYDREMNRKEKSRKALDDNRINLVEKNRVAGLVLQNIVMPCIDLNGFIHIMGDWDGALVGKFSEQLDQIMAEIDKCGLNIQRLHEAIKLLRDKEIPDAFEVDKVIIVLTAVERIRNLEDKHLLKPDPAHPGQKIPINNAYQCTPNVSLLHLLEDHLADVSELKKLREIISEGVDNNTPFATIAANMRTFIKEYRPAKLSGHKAIQPQQQQRVMAHAAGIELDDGDMEGDFGADDQVDEGDNTHLNLAAYASLIGAKRPLSPAASKAVDNRPPPPSMPRPSCEFFAQGKCVYGSRCNKSHDQPQPMSHQVEMSHDDYQKWIMQRNNTAARAASAAGAKAAGTSGAMNPTGKYGRG